MPALQFAAAWAVLVGFLCVAPVLLGLPLPADEPVRLAARLAVLAYGIACTLLLLARPEDWSPLSPRLRLARSAWTMAWLTQLLHVGLAFHLVHDWSHAEAVRHTAEVGGFGGGIWFNYLFTLVWTADVVAWWVGPSWYATRPKRVAQLVHGYLAFITFNAVVVFAEGTTRWLGAALFAWLGVLLVRRYFAASITRR